MKRVALVLALAGCAGAQRHPAITAGVAGAIVGFGACEVDSVSHGTCGIIGGSTAVFLGGVAWLVTTLFDSGDHELVEPDDEAPPVRVDSHDEPPPSAMPLPVFHPPDAGIAIDAVAAVDGAPVPGADAAP